MAHMSRRLGWVLAGVLGVLGCLAAVVVLLLLNRSHPSARGHEGATEPVYFAYGVVFTPKAMPTDPQYLTADDAWTKWEHGHHLTPDITPEFGVLNDQSGNRSAWGFSQRGCMMPNGFPSPRQVALAKSPKCREWTFLNPTTGRQILTTDLYPAKP
jgi:hypothetical protein